MDCGSIRHVKFILNFQRQGTSESVRVAIIYNQALSSSATLARACTGMRVATGLAWAVHTVRRR